MGVDIDFQNHQVPHQLNSHQLELCENQFPINDYPSSTTSENWTLSLTFLDIFGWECRSASVFSTRKFGSKGHQGLAYSTRNSVSYLIIWLVVEPTHLKNMLVKWESSPIFGVKIKNMNDTTT